MSLKIFILKLKSKASPPKENHKIIISCNKGKKVALENSILLKRLKKIHEKIKLLNQSIIDSKEEKNRYSNDSEAFRWDAKTSLNISITNPSVVLGPKQFHKIKETIPSNDVFRKNKNSAVHDLKQIIKEYILLKNNSIYHDHKSDFELEFESKKYSTKSFQINRKQEIKLVDSLFVNKPKVVKNQPKPESNMVEKEKSLELIKVKDAKIKIEKEDRISNKKTFDSDESIDDELIQVLDSLDKELDFSDIVSNQQDLTQSNKKTTRKMTLITTNVVASQKLDSKNLPSGYVAHLQSKNVQFSNSVQESDEIAVSQNNSLKGL